MTRIGVNGKVDAVYLMLILNLYQHLKVFYRMCVNWNNQSGVNTEMLRNIKIPLPEIERQTEIANHISAIRFSAKQLQQQAAAELEQAKQQVEKLILGES
jgi:type I restriction enzyme S subunit